MCVICAKINKQNQHQSIQLIVSNYIFRFRFKRIQFLLFFIRYSLFAVAQMNIPIWMNLEKSQTSPLQLHTKWALTRVFYAWRCCSMFDVIYVYGARIKSCIPINNQTTINILCTLFLLGRNSSSSCLFIFFLSADSIKEENKKKTVCYTWKLFHCGSRSRWPLCGEGNEEKLKTYQQCSSYGLCRNCVEPSHSSRIMNVMVFDVMW